MLAEVEPLEDEEDVMGADDEPLEQLATSVAALFKALLELTTRLYNEPTLESPREVRACVGATAVCVTRHRVPPPPFAPHAAPYAAHAPSDLISPDVCTSPCVLCQVVF